VFLDHTELRILLITTDMSVKIWKNVEKIKSQIEFTLITSQRINEVGWMKAWMEEYNHMSVLRSQRTAYLIYNQRYECLNEKKCWNNQNSNWMFTPNFPQNQPIWMSRSSNKRA